MLEVKIENIIPVTEARDKFNQLVDGVENTDDMYVLTKNGKPCAIIVGVHHLEKLTGVSHEELMGETKEEEKTDTAVDTPVDASTTPASSSLTDDDLAPAQTATPDLAPASSAPIASETPLAPDSSTAATPAATPSSDTGFVYDNLTQAQANTPPAQPAANVAAASDAFAMPEEQVPDVANTPQAPAQTTVPTGTPPINPPTNTGTV